MARSSQPAKRVCHTSCQTHTAWIVAAQSDWPDHAFPLASGTTKRAQEVLDAGSSSSSCCGFWCEVSRAAEPCDQRAQGHLFFDDGQTKINTSTWDQCGRALAGLLNLPISGASRASKGGRTSQYTCPTASASVICLTRACSVPPTKVGPSHEDGKALQAWDGRLQAGNQMGFAGVYSGSSFRRAMATTRPRRAWQAEVGLPEEDFDEITRRLTWRRTTLQLSPVWRPETTARRLA